LAVDPFVVVANSLRAGEEREKEVALQELAFLVHRDQMSQEQAMAQVGALPVIQAMVAHSGSAGIQQQACLVLRSMAKNHNSFPEEVARLGGVEAVQRALQRHGAHSSTLAEEAMWTLQKLSMSKEARQKIVPNGGIELVARTMRQHLQEPGVQERGCILLGNLAFEEDMREHFLYLGTMESIMEAMRAHLHDPGVQEGAILALNNTACSPSLLKRIKDLGGEALLRHALETHPVLNEDGSTQGLLEELADLP